MRNIVHIVPTIPPNINGLGDYCFRLSQNWPHDSIRWNCLALDIPSGAQESWPAAKLSIFKPSELSLSRALQEVAPDTVILHYVGYAYQTKGAPVWLPRALKSWKKQCPQARLAVMFHELWAFGPPWRSCFWVWPAARRIVADLAGLSDAWVTSCQRNFDTVLSVGGLASRGAIIPIATGIEPAPPVNFARDWPLFSGRKLKIAVFGLASTRNTALSLHAPLLRALCEADWVKQISVLGQSPRTDHDKLEMESIITQIGYAGLWNHNYDLSSQVASNLLKEHDIGFVKETASILTKSSVFATLCAHGILPICARSAAMDEKTDSPFLIHSSVSESMSALQNQPLIAAKKKSIQILADTSLNWSCVAQLWMNHMETCL